MNGVDLYADAHQEMLEIHMSVVYKVSKAQLLSRTNGYNLKKCVYILYVPLNINQVHASLMPSVQTTKHVRITTVLTHAQRLVDKGLIVEHKIMLPFVDAQEETQATLSRSFDVTQEFEIKNNSTG